MSGKLCKCGHGRGKHNKQGCRKCICPGYERAPSNAEAGNGFERGFRKKNGRVAMDGGGRCREQYLKYKKEVLGRTFKEEGSS